LRAPANDGVPKAANLRLIVLVLEGYAYLALIVLIFLAAPAFLIWGVLTRRPFIAIVAILIGIPVAATTARALRALWCPFEDPKGVEIGPHFGARLHGEVQEIARRIGAPVVHRIVVTGTNNASAVQIPRAGVFWPRNTLCLGYPLLATLSVDQVRAVIAHELGHMAHAHGRISSWVHRTRLSWVRLLEILEKHASVPAHVYFLFRHYVPRLVVHAASLSRRQELLADQLAADVSGREVAGQTLMAIEIGHDIFDQRFWPRIHERVAEDPNPPNPFSQMGPEIWNAVADRPELLDRLVAEDTGASDTHPALRDRLRALQQAPQWPDPVTLTAADYFFGPQKQQLAATLDEEWRHTHGSAWRMRHGEIRKRRARLAQLAALSSPSPAQTFERGVLTEAEGDADAALDFYMSAHQQGHAPAGLAAGRILLDRDDASGTLLIDAAMDADPDLIEDGCKAIIEILERRGRRAEAYQYQLRMTRQAARTATAHAERTTLSVVDRFRPCTDPRVDASALARRLSGEPGVLRAFLAARELRFSNGTQIVLALLANDGCADDLGERLFREGLLPRDVIVFPLGRHDHRLETALGEGALVFDSGRSSDHLINT
jgi:Zn-dependent protease with chaperone function